MAAAAEKARYHLERSIPELQELQGKKIFSKDEIKRIIKKISDFEHKVNARGTNFLHFVRYAEFEVNLEELRKRKAKRLGVKNSHGLGQKRVFRVLDRATKRFHGEFDLWRIYLDITRKQKAYARATQVITECLRLHPTNPQAWSLAAHYAVDEHGDMSEARNYLQRGLRFCKTSRELWLLFARLELNYLSKIFARQRILGLHDQKEKPRHMDSFDDLNADLIAFSSVTSSGSPFDLETNADTDEHALRGLNKTPAMSGAIVVAIFDAAISNFEDTDYVGRFFDMVCEFESLPCISGIAQHVVETAMKVRPKDPIVLDCWIRLPLVGHSSAEPAFVQSLGVAFTRMRSSLDSNFSSLLVFRTMTWISACLKHDMDDKIVNILQNMQLRSLTNYEESANTLLDPKGDVTASILEIAARDLPSKSETALQWALALWPSNKHLMDLREFRRKHGLKALDYSET